jgi:integrase
MPFNLKFGSGMGQKNTKGTVSINNTDGRIRLRWRYRTIRYSINLNAYNKANLLIAKKAALQIEEDIANDKFDYSLNSYKCEPENLPSVNKSIVQYFEEWTSDVKQMDCEIHTNYNSLRNMLRKWGSIEQGNILKKLNTEIFCATTYNWKTHAN